jgi:hypothetical protein
VNVLDPKVLQNVGIALAKYRMPVQDIKIAILRMDDAQLGIDKVSLSLALSRVCVCWRGETKMS